MLAVKGIYQNGQVFLPEKVPFTEPVTVIVTFLEDEMLSSDAMSQKSQTSFLQFLLDSPEMSEAEYQAIQKKRQHLNQWL